MRVLSNLEMTSVSGGDRWCEEDSEGGGGSGGSPGIWAPRESHVSAAACKSDIAAGQSTGTYVGASVGAVAGCVGASVFFGPEMCGPGIRAGSMIGGGAGNIIGGAIGSARGNCGNQLP
jgi:hypothetical protein